jgi:dTDP-4-dehydrorhamnose 3,5-epimerase-like enzyme
MEIKSHEFRIDDERGSITQITSGLWKQLNIVKSRKGSLRGGHYHKEAKELFHVERGRVEVIFIDTHDKKNDRRSFTEGATFIVFPYEQHYMKYLEDTTLIALYSEEYNPSNPDMFVDEELPNIAEIFTFKQ